MKRVSMNFTDRDIRNTEVITARLNLRNKASTVSNALAITESITRKIANGAELLIRKKDGSMESVVIPGLGGSS